ncbi:MAG TPA: urea transporter [Bacteroidia bacterium]|jgi:urea transporter|nr:urea transporter [Bacteroidia bacterium]
MKGSKEAPILFWKRSILGSYSQVFFSDNVWLAALILVSTFGSPIAGLCGLIAVITSILFSKIMGFSPALTASGAYGYNSLLVGLTMGIFFKFSMPFLVLLLLASCLTVLLTVWLSAVLTAWKVPFLSLPFMIGGWIILLSASSFGVLQLSENGLYAINDLFKIGGPTMVSLYEQMHDWEFPSLLRMYLVSLGAIFFQYNIISGLLIAAGLLAFSRIAFSLSFLGFLSGYMFCYLVQGSMTELDYSHIGFNYILTAVALGGFYLVPSPRSYLLAIFSAPLVALFIAALDKFCVTWQLPLYSLPFSLLTILVLFTLLNRYTSGKLNLVVYQHYSPEKNLYAFLNGNERFSKDTFMHLHLPFYGEWHVSQGHEGTITHREDWKYAWDFVVVDDTQKTFRLPGKELTDFYCYNLPVLAPAAGYVVTLLDGIEDNAIGDVNIGENWGNSIVIKHSEFLFTQISHIRKGSFRVKQGDYVSKGDFLATCGNSGRSPEPHIHFQVQTTPNIGAKTIPHPLAYYAERSGDAFQFHSFENPRQGQHVMPPRPTRLLGAAFHFTPGMTLNFEEDRNGLVTTGKWEIFVDAANCSYIYCPQTKSLAYFTNNGTIHYFTSFSGNRNSLLYYFYLGTHKILLSYFQDLEIRDALPIEGFHKGIYKIIQDFTAPFHVYLKALYSARFTFVDDIQNPAQIHISSTAIALTGQQEKRRLEFETVISDNRITDFTLKEKELCIGAKFTG